MVVRFTLLLLTFIAISGCSKNTENTAGYPTSQQEAESTGTSIARNTDGIPAMAWIEQGELYNPEALIPSQCYTKTESKYNPCYVCHQSYSPDKNKVNNLNDGFLQGTYGFSDEGRNNSWVNLFKDRSAYIDSISDQEILEYIRQDNYSEWYSWMEDNWTSVNPNLQNLQLGADAFDEDGLAKDGSRWVAFSFKSLPSTFWPTNGATNDVMIRLDKKFSEIDGKFSEDLYFANLSLVEMAIKDLDQIAVDDLNEAEINIDLDGDGVYSLRADVMQRSEYFLGDASDVQVHRSLYPAGTEFLHTVRYLDVDENGIIKASPRIKEVRFSRKNRFVSASKINSVNYSERKEKHYENLPTVQDYGHRGMSNRQGWTIWGFIENENGELRKQHFEEQFFCMGCHKSVGSTIDTTYSFPRKVEGADGWGYKDISKIKDVPNKGEIAGEYLTYLKRVGGGDEFRQNKEMLAKWFNSDGTVKEQEISELDSIYPLITPSYERAMKLNKAYHQIVVNQSYIYGRDVNLTPAVNVYKDIELHDTPLPIEARYVWDIRLDWGQQN